MIKDDKVGIVFGRLAPMDEFGSFDGKRFFFDEPAFGLEADAAAYAGANWERIMAQAVWGAHPYGRRSQFQPFVYDLVTKKWELGRNGVPEYNDYYFPIMKRIVARNDASNKGTILSVFDGCELRGIASTFSCWVVNNQGVKSFYDPAADKYTGGFFRDCISEFKPYNVVFDFNEPENAAYPAFFERVILPIALDEKLPWSRLTYGATTKPEKANSIQDQVRAIVRKKYGRVAEKSILSPDHGWPFKENGLLELPDAKILSDDGWYGSGPLASLCDVRPEKGARPSAAAWKIAALRILRTARIADGGRWPILFFEHLPAGFSTGSLDCKLAPIRAISAAYRARFGVWPKNYKP